MSALLIRFAAGAAVVALLVWVVRRLLAQPDVPCATCRHCRRLFDDGTLCGFGNKETFKNPVHVKNCADHQPR